MRSIQLSRHVAGLILLGAALTLAVVAVSAFRWRVDLTEGRLYTVSDGTRGLLRSLDRDVTVKFYFSRRARDLPPAVRLYASRVEDLLREYDRLGGERLTLEIHDPAPLSDEEEWAQRYGLRPLNIPVPGAESVYFGVVGISGTREAVLPALSPEDEPRLEYELTRLIQEIAREGKPVVYLMSGLPLTGEGLPTEGAAMHGGAQPQPPWAVAEQLAVFYDVRELEAGETGIPGETQTLLLVHPAGLSEETLYAIDQFLLRGGRLLAFLDPLNIVSQPQPSSPFGGVDDGKDASDLNRLSSAWGVTLVPDRLAADLESATSLQGQAGGVETDPAVLSLGADRLNRDELVTSDLSFLLMPYAGVFTGKPVEGLRESVLLSTSESAGLIGAFEARFGSAAQVRITPDGQARRLAIRLQGRFPSAFNEGPPASVRDSERQKDEPGDAAASEPAAAGHFDEAVRDGVAVLVADADMLHDAFCVREQRFFGQRSRTLVSDNISFVLNLIDELTGAEGLIGLRSRGEFRRPFTVVQRLEARAQAAYRGEMEALQQRERETRRRLREIQEQMEPDQRMLVTPEQEEAIRQYREELFETERRIRDLRRELMRDVDRVGLWIKSANIALIPLLVAVFGVLHGWHRRRG